MTSPFDRTENQTGKEFLMSQVNPPLGPSGALKVAMELIDAQAAHIKQIERGHWGRDTRARVQELRDELEIVTAAEAAPIPVRPFTNAEYDGTALPAIEGLKDSRQEEHPTPCHRPQIEITKVGDPAPTYMQGHCQHEECPHGFHPSSCGMCTSPAAAYDPGITGQIPEAGMFGYNTTCPSECAAKHPGLEHPEGYGPNWPAG